MLTLSQRDRDRWAVLKQVREGHVSATRGAELVGLTPRHFRRLRRRWEQEGDRAVIHGLRDRRSRRALRAELKEHVMGRVGEGVFRDFGPTPLAEHLPMDPEVGTLGAHTLRRWLDDRAAGRQVLFSDRHALMRCSGRRT